MGEVQWIIVGITFWTLYRHNVDIECMDYIIQNRYYTVK